MNKRLSMVIASLERAASAAADRGEIQMEDVSEVKDVTTNSSSSSSRSLSI